MPSIPMMRPMRAHRSDEPHRVSTPLELLFDLCFVVAISQLVGQWHHFAIEGDFGQGLLRYCMLFFAIWWAWINYTWFASAYDTDDVNYRLHVLVAIAGSLTIAAGIPRAFQFQDYLIVVVGYTIMRLALVPLWLRAWRSDPQNVRHPLYYAIGITLVQLGWIGWLALPESWRISGFFVLIFLDLSVPVIAEWHEKSAWHPHHISERYGLFTLIVIGESVLGATVSFQSAIDEHSIDLSLLALGVGGLLIFFSMWWLYFDHEAGDELARFGGTLDFRSNPFIYGYGHYFIFGAAAAVGGGLEVAVDVATNHAHITGQQGAAVIAIPVAAFFGLLGLLRAYLNQSNFSCGAAYAVAVLLMLGTIWMPHTVALLGLVAAGLVAVVLFVSDPVSHVDEETDFGLAH